ncbi:hypothetical protein HKD37_06G017592 [Glycine soja]
MIHSSLILLNGTHQSSLAQEYYTLSAIIGSWVRDKTPTFPKPFQIQFNNKNTQQSPVFEKLVSNRSLGYVHGFKYQLTMSRYRVRFASIFQSFPYSLGYCMLLLIRRSCYWVLRNMLKQVIGRICRTDVYACEGNRVLPWIYVPSCFFHHGQAHMAPRSFFGVEDFLDDDNSRPYTYQKGKKSKNPNKHISFKQRTIAYMEPFTLDVFISKRFVSASLTHRVTSKQVAVAGTNSKDIKAVLRSRSDIPACIAIGRILAERAKEADVYTGSYTPRDRDKFEGKIRAVVQSLIDNGIDIKFRMVGVKTMDTQ